MNNHSQPKPFDPNWKRYSPEVPFPPYRHLPGVTPHPIRDPLGHSYGIEEEIDENPLSPDMWRQNEAYLYGVDLYNFSYWWEAHEAWEGLWHQTEDTYRLFLQGLIQLSASLIKHHMRMLRPLRTLSTAGRDKLRQVVVECGNDKVNYMVLICLIFWKLQIHFLNLSLLRMSQEKLIRRFLLNLSYSFNFSLLLQI